MPGLGSSQTPGSTDTYGNPIGPEYIDDAAPSGTIAASGTPPTQTSAGTETVYTLAQQATRFLVQNNFTSAIGIELDATATAASIQIPAGQSWRDNIDVTAFHFFTSGNVPINQANGILIRAWK